MEAALTIFDTGHPQVPEAAAAANKARLLHGLRYVVTDDVRQVKSGLVFFPLRQFPPYIHSNRNKLEILLRRDDLTFIQDKTQLRVYENKIEQWKLWGDLMPDTTVLVDLNVALKFVEANEDWPIVSKAHFGSGSHAVRILDKAQAVAEIDAIFNGDGVRTDHGLQTGYLLWQQFIPHDVTYRVTIIGTKIAVYKRFNYPDEPKAAPARLVGLEPVVHPPPGLLDFSWGFFRRANTKYCAIDVLPFGNGWRLLETAMSWARSYRPSDVRFLGTRYSLQTQFDLLMEEILAGAWT